MLYCAICQKLHMCSTPTNASGLNHHVGGLAQYLLSAFSAGMASDRPQVGDGAVDAHAFHTSVAKDE
jgi:hypothetical protein